MTRRLIGSSVFAFAAAVLFLAPVVRGEDAKLVRSSLAQFDYYLYIRQLSEGPTFSVGGDHGDPYVETRRMRVAVVTFGDGRTIFIEEIREGPNGCCNELIELLRVDIEHMREVFSIKQDVSDLAVKDWLSESSFRLTTQGRTFVVSKTYPEGISVDEQ